MGVAGIPTIGFGPGQHRVAHATDESIHLDDMYQASAFYASLAANILHR